MEKLDVLERYFGYRAFRPGQEKLIDGVLSRKDVFGIMPTGGGKSMCYQVPALMLPGITLVVSPLISLMRDQVMALKAAGVPAAYINSTLTAPQLQAVYRNMLAGQYKIIYVAPERLEYGGFGSVASRISIDFVAVDEAHCISQWGQDFRPSYLRIVNFIDSLPKRPVVGAFTATATGQVREDIKRILKLQNPVQTLTGFDRPNLYFEVIRPEYKERQLMDLMRTRQEKSGIIYCSTRKKVETVCEKLLDEGFSATRYHAGLTEEERTRNQEDFLYDRKTVMVATNAFGMGIDKSNVSFVIHYNMPKSLEAYYQEAGRAGRDGTDAECILLYNSYDVTTAKFLINSASENEDLTPKQQEMVRQQDLKRLEAMVGYCKTELCLRGYILEYFGQKHPEVCGNCGSCRGDFETVDITRESQMILSCIKRIYDKVGTYLELQIVTRVLQGSREKRVLELELNNLSTYGLMKSTGSTEIREMVDQLERDGYVDIELEQQTVVLKPEAGQVLYHGKSVQMLRRREKEIIPASKTVVLSGDETELLDALKQLRYDISKESGVPPYTVFTNASLSDMVKKKPKNLTEFRKVSGVGEIKANWYGKDFVQIIRQHLKQTDK